MLQLLLLRMPLVVRTEREMRTVSLIEGGFGLLERVWSMLTLLRCPWLVEGSVLGVLHTLLLIPEV